MAVSIFSTFRTNSSILVREVLSRSANVGARSGSIAGRAHL